MSAPPSSITISSASCYKEYFIQRLKTRISAIHTSLLPSKCPGGKPTLYLGILLFKIWQVTSMVIKSFTSFTFLCSSPLSMASPKLSQCLKSVNASKEWNAWQSELTWKGLFFLVISVHLIVIVLWYSLTALKKKSLSYLFWWLDTERANVCYYHLIPGQKQKMILSLHSLFILLEIYMYIMCHSPEEITETRAHNALEFWEEKQKFKALATGLINVHNF